MPEFTPWDVIHDLLIATGSTILLSLVAFIGGSTAAIIVVLARTSRSKPLRIAAALYIDLIQGTPPLMQLFLLFFGLGIAGLDVPAWAAAALGLILWASAFLGEIWRGCIESVSKGQWEASESLGMRYLEQVRYVILPQALRVAIAPTVGFSVQLIKATAATSIIGFVELSRAGAVIANATLRPLEVYGVVALIYFCLCWPLSRGSRAMEERLRVDYHS